MNLLKRTVIVILLMTATTSAVFAQDTSTPSSAADSFDPTPGALPQLTETPTTEPSPTIVPTADPRVDTCNAAMRPNFIPYIVRDGDTLANLLTGQDIYNVTQVALINCIEDPNVLPVGGVIFLPNIVPVDSSFVYPDDADPTVSEAEINTFTVEQEHVLNQEGATLSWQAIGSQAYVYPCPSNADAACSRPALLLPLPPNYSLTLHDFAYAGNYRYRLEVVDGEAVDTADFAFEVACSQVSLGASTGAYQRCPENPPIAVYAAWQPFEGGVMLYFSDTAEIWVLYNGSQRVQVFADTWKEGDDNPDDEAPDDRLTPTRGFGKIWTALGGAQASGLGWALAEEIGFDSARQSAGRDSFTTYIQGPGETVYTVTMIPTADNILGFWS